MAGKFSLESIFRATDRFTRPIAKMQAAHKRMLEGMSSGLKSLDSTTSRIAGGLTKLGAIAAGIGTAGGAALFNIGRAGADFEQAITNVGAVSLMTRDQIADLEKKALELGATTKFSATEVAAGMELMGKAGFTNAEILQGIGGVLAAAAADGAELAETSGHISNVLKGMGLATSEASRVADVLTLASSRTNSSIASLGESMANVSSTARQFRIPLEDTVAAVAMLQDVGLDASEAGSAVNTMLTQMAAPSKKATTEMKRLGISFRDSKGNMLPLTDVLGQLQKSAEKSGGNMQQVAFFAELVGLRGQKAAANLKDLFVSGKFTALAEELRGAAGSAEKMASIRMDTFLGDIETLGGSIDSLKIDLFNLKSGPLRGVVQETTKWVDANKDLIVSKVGETIEKIVASKDDIIAWGKGIGAAALGFIALRSAVVVANTALATYELAAKAAGLASTMVEKSARLSAAALRSEAVATVASGTATRARAAAQWVANAAINIGRLATTGFTAATITGTGATAASTVAGWANSAATWARNAATRALTAAQALATTVIAAYQAGTLRSTLAEGAHTAAIFAKNIAARASAVVMAIAAVAHGNFATSAIGAAAANGSLIASFAPFLVTVAAATAAVGALVALWQQWKSFGAESEGLGVTGTIGEMMKRGTLNPFEAIDAFQNDQARTRAGAEARQTVTPQERVARTVEESTTTNRAEVTVSPAKGTKATVTKAPKNFPLKVAPSGAF